VDACYRHPARPTGVRCSNCDRPICPDCMTTTSVGMRCPECAPQRSRVSRAAARGATTDTPVLTYILIGICVALELGVLSSGGGAGGGFGGSNVIGDLALYGPAVAAGDYWRLITSGFMHAGLAHLLFNMFSLYILGSLLEPAVGRLRFAIIYFVSLLSGSLGVLLISPNEVTVGASGAVFGLMSAAIIVLRNRGFDVMASGLPFWLGLNLLFTFSISGISVGGHIGGLIGGALVAILLYEAPSRVRGLPRYAPTLLAAALGLVVVGASIAVA
jgi:membrane associated rhomboid family serine protease